MAEREGLRVTGEAVVLSMFPDVCKTPPSMVPVPYQILGRFSDGVRYVDNVCMTSMNVMTMDGRLPTVYGNEAGTGGGILSGVNKGWCRPITHSPTVYSKGHPITFHNSFYWMNCAGPDGQWNTIGRVTYIECVSGVALGPLGQIVGVTNPALAPDNAAEKPFYEKLWNGAAPIFSKAWDGVVSAGEFGKDFVHVSAAGWTMLGTDFAKQLGADVEYPSWTTSEATKNAADHVESGVVDTVDGVKTLGGLGLDAAQVSAAGWTIGGTEALNASLGTSFEPPDWATGQSTENAHNRVSTAVESAWSNFTKGISDANAEGGPWQVTGHLGAQALLVVAEALAAKGLGRIRAGASAVTEAVEVADATKDVSRAVKRFENGVIVTKRLAGFGWPTPKAKALLRELKALLEKPRGTVTQELKVLSEELGNEAAKQHLRNKLGREIADAEFLEFKGKSTVNLLYKDPVTGKIHVLEAKGGMSKPSLGDRLQAFGQNEGVTLKQGSEEYLHDIAEAMKNSSVPLKQQAGNDILDAIATGNYEYTGVWGQYGPGIMDTPLPPKEIFSIGPN